MRIFTKRQAGDLSSDVIRETRQKNSADGLRFELVSDF